MKQTRLERAKRQARRDRCRTLADVALMLRRMFAPERRFTGPTYISRNGTARRVYGDAFAEVLLGERRQVATMCARWPMTVGCFAALEAAAVEWAEVFDLNGATS